jgi:hypothetical protein
MSAMDTAFVNRELEAVAKRTLIHIAEAVDTLQPLYLQPDHALFLAENLHIIFKVYMIGNALQHEDAIAQKVGATGVPTPEMLVSGRQQLWEACISWRV